MVTATKTKMRNQVSLKKTTKILSETDRKSTLIKIRRMITMMKTMKMKTKMTTKLIKTKTRKSYSNSSI